MKQTDPHKIRRRRNGYFLLAAVLGIAFALFIQFVRADSVETICSDYIEKWRQFYPSPALASGDTDAAPRFENISTENIRQWLAVNKSCLDKMNRLKPFNKLPQNDRIDIRLLYRHVLTEIEKWESDRLHVSSPAYYAGLISQAVTHLIARDNLEPVQRLTAIQARLKGVSALCDTGIRQLTNGTPQRTRSAAAGLDRTADFFETQLPLIVQRWFTPGQEPNTLKTFKKLTSNTATKIRQLASHINEKILPATTLPDAMGNETFSRKLKIYTYSYPDTPLTPETLESIALEEIETVRSIMVREAEQFWREQQPDVSPPSDLKQLLAYSLEAMESNRVDNQADFLKQFEELILRAETFIRQNNIASLPEKRTLFTALSPSHFAGAAVGGVYPAGPFNPEADTLFYLPTVPDSAPEDAKEGFYRSFNTHFNTMIITHEIYPGHYMQLKAAASHPHRVRALFADDIYVEGWASLCELITLDEGWDGNNRLTRLAHLRKRLENAVRAYAAVQVHCNGWNRDKLIDFALNKGLLAPQFAVNLWNRAQNSPLQLTSYFLGFRAFHESLRQLKERLKGNFSLKEFSDKIIAAGSFPMNELKHLFPSVGRGSR